MQTHRPVSLVHPAAALSPCIKALFGLPESADRHGAEADPAPAPQVPEGDALWQLAPEIREAITRQLGVNEAQQLVDIPERHVLAIVRDLSRVGERGLAMVTRWLAAQRQAHRLAQQALARCPIEAKGQADDVLTLARHDIGRALCAAIAREHMSPDDVARRCGTSRETVVRLLAGAPPASLELALRMAAVLGVAVSLQVD
ncbi:MAG: helix-turn-helix transcriptional regulator [Leptothrix sp. (in: b-proteobacteria)]